MTPFTLERVTQPEIEVVTLGEMKVHLRGFASVTEDDATINEMIVAAREWAEDFTGRALIDQTWRLNIGDVVAPFANVDSDTVRGVYTGVTMASADGGILLRKSPVLAITSIKSVDSLGAETTLGAGTYQLREADGKWPRVVPLSGSLSGNLRIVYRAGYADRVASPGEEADVVPARFKQAIKLYCEALYDRDEKMMEKLIEVAQNLIRPERCDLQMA